MTSSPDKKAEHGQLTSTQVNNAIESALGTMEAAAPTVVKSSTVKGRQVEALVGEVISTTFRKKKGIG